MRTLPATLPAWYVTAPGQTTPGVVNDGGYDLKIGGFGFRLASDQQNPYIRATEPTTDRRFDDSLEPGEQSLSPLPWIKSQSSFHGGAGQLNLEQGFTAFQYQQEQVEHIRFDTSVGVDCWTPGKVTRLPTTLVSNVTTGITQFVTGTVGGLDCGIGGGVGLLKQYTWASGPAAAPTVSTVDLTGAHFGGAANCTVASLVTDGQQYYALIQLTVVGDLASVKTLVVKGSLGSNAAPTVIYKSGATGAQMVGCLGWAKARLLAGLDRKLYELDTAPAGAPVDVTTLTAKYTHPSPGWTWTCFAESPTAVLASGNVGFQSDILGFVLDTSGAVPTLTGGVSVGILPHGEQIFTLGAMLGSFLAIGTSRGVRVGTFNSGGALSIGPLSVSTNAPVLSMTGRDRFIYAGYTNQQADGKTGLIRIDLSFVIDATGRLASAPDLRPPSTAATGLGTVSFVGLLPSADRLAFISTDGIHVEQAAPSADDPAWLRTSRIRYDTTEMKLFSLGRITGTLDSASVKVDGVTPFDGTKSLGTFGFLVNGNSGDFALPGGLNEWIQLQFTLNGAACILSTYQVKAYPAPKRQHVITLTVNCFNNESDSSGLDVTDPQSPRDRYQNVRDLEAAGDVVSLVEFTNSGAVVEQVLIDQIAYIAVNRPSADDDFGGLITFKLRVV